ncbi:hypothetical protein L204_104955 [Cryptococcus depauperatus]|nr:hypothetical protein L204_05466 [Cryptococcus depauperatus CBS 7855]
MPEHREQAVVQKLQNLHLESTLPYGPQLQHPQQLPQPQLYQPPYAQPYTPYQHFQNPYPHYVSYGIYPEHLVWQGAPGSEQTSPVNMSNQAFGMWTNSPVNPVNAPPFLTRPSRHESVDEYSGLQGAPSGHYSGQSSYGDPSSAWASSRPPTFGFYTSYQPPLTTAETVMQPSEWNGSPVYPYSLNMASAGGGSKLSPTDQKEPERKPYHPQPPSHRSDWVMWVGNVPNNTSHEELWHFFNMIIPTTNSEADAEPWRGPSSIFLISRSSCAFVNLSSQVDLDRAIAHFNGKVLRPWDPRCPKMVCRVRRKDDDLRSGVGAQRGTGMHRDWVKKQKEQEKVASQSAVFASAASSDTSVLKVTKTSGEMKDPESFSAKEDEQTGKDDQQVKNEHKASSGSYASTNSSFLIKHFPRRIFILKSLTTAELEESVITGMWKTQRHNEPILDQAFRTSQAVFLIFGANKSGEFFGYARMVEPINKEQSKKQQSYIGTTTRRSSTAESDRFLLSPYHSRVTTLSPGEFGPRGDSYFHPMGHRKTDPPKVPNHAAGGSSMFDLPVLDESRAHTFDPKTLQRDKVSSMTTTLTQAAMSDIEKNPTALSQRAEALEDKTTCKQASLLSSKENAKREKQDAQEEFAQDGWGHVFRIEWLKIAPLPFNRTCHLRNPWNAEREVKVSRDGTEVEPSVGLQLMAEWDKSDIAPRISPNLTQSFS